MTIGERIKQARNAKGLTQKQLGAISGTSEITIRQYELGKRQPRLEQLQRIADVLNVGVSYLLSGSATVSQIHLANGVHIYKSTFPFKVIEPFLDSELADLCDISYQDEYLIVAVEKESTVTDEELKKILDAYAPLSEDVAEFLSSVTEGEFHTRMNAAFHELNFSGKQEAAKRVEELTEIPRYRRQDTPKSPASQSEGADTTPPPTTPEKPPEDE